MRKIGIKEVKRSSRPRRQSEAINSEAWARRKKFPHLVYVYFNLPEAVKKFAERNHDMSYTKRPITIQDYHPPPGAPNPLKIYESSS